MDRACKNWINDKKFYSVFHILFLLCSGQVLSYQWLEFNDKFDCTVGITVDDKPISIGVFISTKTVITSANPLNQYLNKSERIKIHTVSKVYKKSVQRKVKSIAGNQSFRKQSWVTIGYNDTSHTSIHDIVLINLIEADEIPRFLELGRGPFPVNLPYIDSYFYGQGWVFAGFGYIDQGHIEDNNVLEVSYVDAVLVDCDEWIPREWGRFICLLDDENLAALASGAPLFHSNDLKTIYAIGSFILTKDKDKILVFTDLRPYIGKLYGYI